MPMPVKVHSTEIPEVVVYETGIARDDRGYFQETYSTPMLAKAGLNASFVQDNVSKSKRGTVRGLHYQLAPFATGKLVRTVRGSIFDVAVDVRRGSPTFGKWVGRTLTEENHLALWIPEGFAHGFMALEDETLVLYKCTVIHTPESERSLHHADPAIGIEWPMAPTLIAPKDAAAPMLAEADYNFVYPGSP
jgi:dTDP-4-dehydrorhamnose 3,5-epimerase